MLAALLCNLEEEVVEKRPGGVSVTVVFDKPKEQTQSAAEQIEALLRDEDAPKVAKLKRKAAKVSKKVAELASLPTVEFERVAQIGREVDMLVFEMRRSVAFVEQIADRRELDEYLAVLQIMAVLQAYIMDEEEAIILLLSTI